MIEKARPNPDEILARIKQGEMKALKGNLKIYLGMCAGVGKTFTMLQDASKVSGKGKDILIGFVETHGRAETEFLLFHLPQLSRKQIKYKGFLIEEMDIDSIIAKKPKLAVVDELAHTNAAGSRHIKRYQDVIELLDNGIDVYTTVNVQHIESLADTVQNITGIRVTETVPDSILDMADEIELIDISPDDLIQRLKDGKVYTADKTEDAINNFFRKGNLSALRELSLRITANRVERQVRDYMQENRISGPWKSTQRILIGIGPSPNSANLIRWARRIAYTMEASWITVNVETQKILSPEQKKILNKNIELAKELGAEVIFTADTDIVKGIIRTARAQNATLIVIGKSRRQRILPWYFTGDIVNRLIDESGKIDVYVVSGEDLKSKKSGLSGPHRESGISLYFISVFTILLIAALCYPFSDVLGYQTIALILLLVVSLLPLLFGPGPVIISAILSPVIWNYFFVPPRFTILISRTEDILMFVMFLIIAFVSSVLTTKIRKREKAVRQREETAVALYNLADELSHSSNLEEVIKVSDKNLRKVFNAYVIFLLFDFDKNKLCIFPPSNNSLSDKEFSVAYWAFMNNKKAGRNTDTLPFAKCSYFPVSGPRGTYGAVGISINDDIVFKERESLLENFIRQTGSAVEREILNERAKRTLLLEESEKLYKTIFDSISHELKTPIAAIMSASTFQQNSSKVENKELMSQLFYEINYAALRLNNLVENLLSMAKIESGRLVPDIKECDVNDLFNSVLSYFEKELTGREIAVNVPDDMPFVRLDFTLMELALKNIMQNAIKYSNMKGKIEFMASFDDNFIYFDILDNGSGISEHQLEHLFDKFYRIRENITGGIGLGLSIAKGIADIHKGTIQASNRISGGLKIRISLPK